MRHFFTLRQSDMGATKEKARIQLAMLVLMSLRNAIYVMQGPHVSPPPVVEGYSPIVINYFEEDSTRTKISNWVAALRLGCNVVDVPVEVSSSNKREILEDTMDTFAGYQPLAIVMRNKTKGAARHLAHVLQDLEGPTNWIAQGCSIISGGEGNLTHAQQFLLDLVTMFAEDGFADQNLHVLNMDQWQDLNRALHSESEERLLERICSFIDNLRICFIGDSKNSRIASSAVHVGEYFDISYLFVGPKELRIDTEALSHINADPSDSFEDAKSWPRLYMLRTQIERLIGTPDAPGYMSKEEALRLVDKFVLSEAFLTDYHGKVYHARPRDGEHPMIPLHLKDRRKFPQLRFMPQSFFGVPTRMGIYQACYAGRGEQVILLPEPSLDESLIIVHSDPNHTWADHQAVLARRYEGKEMAFSSVKDGFCVDRLGQSRWLIHDALLHGMGAYKGATAPVGRYDGLWSGDRQVFKAVITVFGKHLDPLSASIQGLVSPDVRFSIMRMEEVGANTPGSYQRVEYPLPRHVKGFGCLDPDCITNRTGTAQCIHRVVGEKGSKKKNGWPNAMMECVYCEAMASAKRVVLHQYGAFLR